MKLRLLTLFSIIVALAVKTYTINAQDEVIDDYEVEMLATVELINKSDSVYHQKHIDRIVKVLEESAYVAEETMGLARIPTETHIQYERLKKAANDSELNKLLVHKSPVIRVYAHRAMMEKQFQPSYENLSSIAADSSGIWYYQQDVLCRGTVMDLVSDELFTIKKDSTQISDSITPLFTEGNL